MRWVGQVVLWGRGEAPAGFLVGKGEGRRPLGRQRRRCENDIKMDLREVAWSGWIWLRIRTAGGLL
jgi:hypothetical protein